MEEMIAPLNYDSPHELSQFLDALGIAPRKRWGQNFLINSGARTKIVQLLDITSSDTVLEIGPGLGAMSWEALTLAPKKLVVFEIDPAYQQILRNFFAQDSRFALVAGDVLKTWAAYFEENSTSEHYKIIGNLPYNISAAIIQRIATVPFHSAVLTVQKELAMRLMAKPKTKNYSSLSVWSQCNFTIAHHGTLKAGSFYPQPNVESSIITLQPRHTNPKLLETLDHLLGLAFAHRRKILKHNWLHLRSSLLSDLNQADIDTLLAQHAISYTMRAEEICSDTYLALAQDLLHLTSL
jgi:16S rRNA (adenine1518-N6/adenine1519-N6)-dimethyltransferase